MNYPVWEVPFGSGLLVAVVSIAHVFVSHFAIGGGLFLVVTEARAARQRNQPLLGWVKRHTRFFVLLTVVFGAVSGVGIWFTIGLANPSGTSALIHTFVWGWAIEWVFFFLEITAALLYLHGWNRMDRRTHLWFGWIYFITAYLSLVVINGIITFMLTPGDWLATRGFWDGFFNPGYFPSLAFRTGICVALAGLYAFLTAARERDLDLKAAVVRWSGRWTVVGLAAAAVSALWYVGAIPDDAWSSARGKMPTATRYADLILWFTGATAALAAAAWLLPRRLNTAWAAVMLLAALGAMGSFEFIRESIRKPHVIRGYLYANGIYVNPGPGQAGLNAPDLRRRSALAMARWSRVEAVTADNRLDAGRELFVLQCMACHTLDGYRSLGRSIRDKRMSENRLAALIKSLDRLHNGTMPPFAGTDEERLALAAFLAARYPVAAIAPAGGGDPAKIDGDALFERSCSECHERDPEDVIVERVKKQTVDEIAADLGRLEKLNEAMPPFEGTEAERRALAAWLAEAVQRWIEEG